MTKVYHPPVAARDWASDMRAAFIGLILGAVVLGALLFGIVKWTNSRYAGEPAPAASK